MAQTLIDTDHTHVLPLELDERYPVVVRGEGAWVEDAAGNRYLDAMSGGSMAATLGHGRSDLVAAARAQADDSRSFITNAYEPRPGAARARAGRRRARGLTRVRFVTSGADANEMAIQLARSYHVERGEPERWQMISPAQAYHGPTMETLGLTGRPGLQGPFGPYLRQHLHIPPRPGASTPPGGGARRAGRAPRVAGPRLSAFFCEAISAAALPGYTPPPLFWEGLAERRERHGFLVSSTRSSPVGRVGEWFAGAKTACPPDLIATAKGLGAGYAAIGAVLSASTCTRRSPSGSGRSRSVTRGTGRRSRARSGSRSSTRCEPRAGRACPRPRARGCATSWRRRWRASRWCARCAATATCSGCPSSTRGRRHVPAAGASRRRAGRRRRVRPRADHPVDPADARRLRGRPVAVRAAFTATDDELAEMVSRFAAAVREVVGASRADAGRAPDGGRARDAAGADPPARGADAPRPHHGVARRARGRGGDVSGSTCDDREIDPTNYDLIVSLGSEFAAFDDIAAVRAARGATDADPSTPTSRTRPLLRRADARAGARRRGVPRRTVRRSVGCRCGAKTPSWCRRGRGSSGTSTCSRSPPGATVIAETDLGPQAFVAGRSLGLQFHPEVTTEIMDEWVRAYRHELDERRRRPRRAPRGDQEGARAARRTRWNCSTRTSNDVAQLGRA